MYLALQPFLAGVDLARHALEDARQLTQSVPPSNDLVQGLRLKASCFHRRRGVGQAPDLLQVLQLEIAQALAGQGARDPGAKER